MKSLAKGFNILVLAAGGLALISGVLAIIALLVAPMLARL